MKPLIIFGKESKDYLNGVEITGFEVTYNNNNTNLLSKLMSTQVGNILVLKNTLVTILNKETRLVVLQFSYDVCNIIKTI